ncbi:MAG: Nif3-like dinuclear metal center hexameric protein [Acidimicrobiia bacterium]|nr:Nif3-like dinuclear metal center hexameric protein [Acidimicrobiia bacterium]
MPTVAEVVAWSRSAFPESLAEPWDSVGLVCGQPEAKVNSILVTVDVTEQVVELALARGCKLILAHHPLLFEPVNSIASTSSRGRILTRLIQSDIALLTAHTNADAAAPGVSDALAGVLDLVDVQPVVPTSAEILDKLVVFVPPENANRLLDALSAAGAGRLGQYERCAYQVDGMGTFRPIGSANPTIGRLGQIESVRELRLEMVLPRSRRTEIVRVLREVHPYEEPAFDVIELAPVRGDTGLGRIGRLREPVTLAAFTERVAAALPSTAQGVRVAGDLERQISSVAVCGGSGDSLLAKVDRLGADVFVTADLRHHRAGDHLADGTTALVDVAHWASEFPWLWQLAAQIEEAFGGFGANDVETRGNITVEVCELRTDPWRAALRSRR